ncbi:laccase 1 isoform X1 [Tribolium castaneum]|uniref:Laccase 1 n=1 Tax=Tribolium castaneum TaxID=7070 RepID=Q49I37_TRICA|nr:laccase 1 [Tribolium castaneum]XP_008201239.1 PREDICTED: laccase 1 isoform X1 [Tribolium castaneum]XP_008201241.1 PREDICTED: laccase 1 isoform X1 [Tribolium castaneum]XP_015839414.1 PREDICTED: laccase 1 isoform X1 [Tribolium castaneum]XP_015839422.1 PREDICTED: laccase 1 isoform X1 [Tribolium castaneum]AAX84206.1 laccase 1 [Tribolium castaneum]EEZ98364.1 Laccase-5-like Protein [Tribolium castaneum]|eukprot:NP_001034514.1 laccase 1 [Tribolium castaneum]
MKKITLFMIIICFERNLSYKVMYNGNNNVTDLVEYVLLNEDNPCARKCVKDSVPMTCRYTFLLEWYHTLSKACYDCPYNTQDCYREDCIPGDGNKRSIIVVNRKMPGPSVEVCLGDEVIIDVVNHLSSDSTTIHWHGHHQKNSPYMDGVPFVTQCPIHPGMTFRYHFNVHNSGTHFWHSHSGFQRSDGTFGPFIVRVPEEDNPHAKLYDYDLSSHVITILDWTKEDGTDKFMSHIHNDGDNKPDTILVNGFGRFKHFVGADNSTVFVPTARFTVEQGYRYRFRVINAGFLNCPIEVSIDNHTLSVISTDGSDFNATEVDSLVTYAGERFDFIVTADQPQDVYWMHFRGLMDCDERFTRAYQVAVLEYKGTQTNYPSYEPTYDNSRREGKQLNPLNKGTEADSSFVTLPQLHSLDEWDDTLKEKADFQYYVSYDFYKMNHPVYHKDPHYGFHNVTNTTLQNLTPQLNYISMKLQSFPLLSQRHQIDAKMFCNESSVSNCENEYCECTHVVNIPLGTVVEMVLIDKGYAYDANHPFHLHGHSFRVVAMERVGSHVNVSEILKMDQNGQIKRNLVDAPLKDTVTVPDGGFTIIRFKATNPGYWLFHCHIEFHVEVGMALVFKIGEDYEMPPVPKDFPQCGDYVPSGNSTVDCDDVGTFGAILKKLLPKVYEDYCPTSNSGSVRMSHLGTLVPLILFMLWG